MIEKKILEAIQRFSLLQKGDCVTVALSGGADSVALLYALNSLKEALQITVDAAHLNHQIRGDEALRDQSFSMQLCNSLGIEFKSEIIDVPEFAKENSLGLEAAARAVRYDFLSRVAKGKIATAHTASDNLETVILNLTRGSALDGMAGIPPIRGNIIRPLYFCTRQEIEEYCKAKGLNFVTDSTNLSDDYTRNKIRHSVVPVLKEINPNVENAVIRCSLNLRDVADCLKIRAGEYIENNLSQKGLNVKSFADLDLPLAKKIITEFVNTVNNKISLENCHIEEIYKICIGSGRTGLPCDYYCRCSHGFLELLHDKDIKKTDFECGISTVEDFSLEKEQKINNLLLNNALDCDKIVGKLVIRTRMAGDSIRLSNRGITKPLKKLYNENNIPVILRDKIPVIADDEGVVWVKDLGVAKRSAVDKNTKKAYIIKVEEKGD